MYMLDMQKKPRIFLDTVTIKTAVDELIVKDRILSITEILNYYEGTVTSRFRPDAHTEVSSFDGETEVLRDAIAKAKGE